MIPEMLLSLGVSDFEPHLQGICGQDCRFPHPATLDRNKTKNQGCGGRLAGDMRGAQA